MMIVRKSERGATTHGYPSSKVHGKLDFNSFLLSYYFFKLTNWFFFYYYQGNIYNLIA